MRINSLSILKESTVHNNGKKGSMKPKVIVEIEWDLRFGKTSERVLCVMTYLFNSNLI